MNATTNIFSDMGKEELRAACRTAGISYSKLNNDGMRAALVAHYAPSEEGVHIKLTESTDAKNARLADEALEAEPVVAGPNFFGALLGKVAPPAFTGNSIKAVDGKIVNPDSEQADAEKEVRAPRPKRVKTPPPVVPRASYKGLKIQKERLVQNGKKRPSVGGVCEAVWCVFDKMHAEGKLCRADELPAIADAHGWNRNNVTCEYYAWRKFMGIKGRSV